MARSSTGKSVARAAATGGGTSYRGQMPVNWYAALVLIVLLGIGSVALARHNYTKGRASVPPIVGQTWHAGLAVDICGTAEPALPATASGSSNGLTTTGSGVLLIAPKTSSEAGNNATLGKFASEYEGMKLTNTSVMYPAWDQVQERREVRQGHSRRRSGGSGPRPILDPVVRQPEERQRGQAGRRQVLDEAGRPQTSQCPVDHPRIRPVQQAPAQGSLDAPKWLSSRRSRGLGARDDDHHRPDGDDDDDHRVHHDHHDQIVQHDHDDQTDQLMKAVVLVGGEGTRLRPLTLSTPKQMLPIVGVPMLERVLAHLGAHGIDEAILSLGYLPDAFKEAYPDGHAAGISLTYAVEDEPLDTAGALRFAATYGGSRRHIRRRQRRRAHRPRPRLPDRLPSPERGGGHHCAPSGARPVGLRSGPDRRRRTGDRVCREATS